ncbi:DUF4391 domain-containing protein [Salimicrobium jeotgali]|uniref:DUF4391 domain-containing protein n=1 Tax=Salimicrobium jeotgali TaxID=1230341 RepID=UPI0014725665|nr:DUF4391 domain-containing protein [Salimicrobium jeotgali]MBM7697528.1 hypothetical protein [Salimicrobium jeotgali]
MIEKLQMPKRTVLNRNIPKKQFYEQAELSNKEKELIKDDIESVYLLSICRQDTLNVPKYVDEDLHYEEIYWVFVSLKSTKHFEKVCKTIHRAFPNPVVLVCSNAGQDIAVSTGHKRLNQNVSSKSVVEELSLSPFIDPYSHDEGTARFIERLNFRSLSHQNLYIFYEDISKATEASQIISIIGSYPRSEQSLLDSTRVIKEINLNLKELLRLKKEHNDQTDFGEKMNIYMNIKQVEAKKEQLLNQLKELC